MRDTIDYRRVAMIELGWTPLEVRVRLTTGQDWFVTFSPKPGSPDPDWPVGTTVDLVLYDPNQNTALPLDEWEVVDTWSATIDDQDVVWAVDHAAADAIPDGAHVKIFATYPNPPDDDNYVWMQGRVNRRDST